MNENEGLHHKNLLVITRLVDEPKKQPNRIFLHEKLVLTVITDCRTVATCRFRERLAFKSHDVISTKEQVALRLIKDAF